MKLQKATLPKHPKRWVFSLSPLLPKASHVADVAVKTYLLSGQMELSQLPPTLFSETEVLEILKSKAF